MCFDESPLMCWAPPAQGGSCCRALSAFLRGRGQWKQRGLSGADKRSLQTDRRHLGVWWCDSARRPSGLSSAAPAQLASGCLRSGFYVWLAGGVAVGKSHNASPQILSHRHNSPSCCCFCRCYSLPTLGDFFVLTFLHFHLFSRFLLDISALKGSSRPTCGAAERADRLVVLGQRGQRGWW